VGPEAKHRDGPHRCPTRFTAVLFDLDGTLVDTSADIATGVNATLAEHGFGPLPIGTVLEHVGRGVRVLMQSCFEQECRVSPDDVGGLDRVVSEFRRNYAAHLLDTTRLYPGIREMIDRLHAAGIAMAVVSNKPEDLSRRILEGLRLDYRFVAVLGGDTLPSRKPDPAPLLHALERIGPPRAAAPAMVGDSEIDIEAARAAAIPVAAVAWGFGPQDRLAKAAPDHLAHDPADLEGWLTGPS